MADAASAGTPASYQTPEEYSLAFKAWAEEREVKLRAEKIALIEPDTTLSTALNPAINTYIAAPVDVLPAALDKLIELPSLEDELFTLVATTNSIHSLRIPEALPKYIAALFDGVEGSFDSFKLALAEAVLNATEHGNLDLSAQKSELITSEDYFGKFYDMVERRLADPEFGNRLIVVRCNHVGVWLKTSVQHEGEPFDFKSVIDRAHEPLTESAHERGLRLLLKIVEHVSYSDQGRCLNFSVPVWQGVESSNLLTAQEVYESGKILVVDDQHLNRELARHFLGRAGFKYVYSAAGGEEALRVAAEVKPDLILLDIMMPDIDGFEVCRRLKRNPRLAQIPVIYLSALTDISSRTKGYELGAVDYINKPIQHNEMLARAEVHIKNGMLLNRLQNYTQRVQAELSAARQFQADLLPSDEAVEEIADRFGLNLQSIYQASQELAGDYWTVLPIDEDNFALILADFVGHGVVSALNTVRLHGALHEISEYWGDPRKMAEGVNGRLHTFLPEGQFTTACFGVYNRARSDFTYVSCGHPPIGVIPAKGNPVLISKPGFPLGVAELKEEDFELHKIGLNKHDTLVFCSDALLESEHQNGPRWDETGLLEVMSAAQKDSPADIFSFIRNRFFKTANKPLQDDVTLITLQRQD